MNTQPKQKISVQTLTQLAILVAIEVVMKLIGLGSVPVGPLYLNHSQVRLKRIIVVLMVKCLQYIYQRMILKKTN